MLETYEFYQRAGESSEELAARAAQMQGKFLSQSLYAVAGNYVSIQHANGEYSHSLHLAEGSVRLQVGSKVEQGDVIGRLGHSGNSTGAHLHFQVTDGPDLMYSRGLPTIFKNAGEQFDLIKDQSPASGWFIETTD